MNISSALVVFNVQSGLFGKKAVTGNMKSDQMQCRCPILYVKTRIKVYQLDAETDEYNVWCEHRYKHGIRQLDIVSTFPVNLNP